MEAVVIGGGRLGLLIERIDALDGALFVLLIEADKGSGDFAVRCGKEAVFVLGAGEGRGGNRASFRRCRSFQFREEFEHGAGGGVVGGIDEVE